MTPSTPSIGHVFALASKLEELAKETRTIVLYESPHRVGRTLAEIHEKFGDREVAVAREITKKFEEVARGKLSDVLLDMSKRQARGGYVIVISGAKRA